MTVASNPTKILINGVVFYGWKYNKSGKVTMNLAAESINEKQVIVIR
jgi:hypothetical protein